MYKSFLIAVLGLFTILAPLSTFAFTPHPDDVQPLPKLPAFPRAPVSQQVLPMPQYWPPFDIVPTTVQGTVVSVTTTTSTTSTLQSGVELENNGEKYSVIVHERTVILDSEHDFLDISALQAGEQVTVLGKRWRGSESFIFGQVILKNTLGIDKKQL